MTFRDNAKVNDAASGTLSSPAGGPGTQQVVRGEEGAGRPRHVCSGVEEGGRRRRRKKEKEEEYAREAERKREKKRVGGEK